MSKIYELLLEWESKFIIIDRINLFDVILLDDNEGTMYYLKKVNLERDYYEIKSFGHDMMFRTIDVYEMLDFINLML